MTFSVVLGAVVLYLFAIPSPADRGPPVRVRPLDSRARSIDLKSPL